MLCAVDGQDGIAILEAGVGGRAGGSHLGDQRPLGLGSSPRLARRVLVDVLDLDAEPAAADGAGDFSCVDDFASPCRRNGEGDTDVAAGGAVDGGVDAHHLAIEVEGRDRPSYRGSPRHRSACNRRDPSRCRGPCAETMPAVTVAAEAERVADRPAPNRRSRGSLVGEFDER